MFATFYNPAQAELFRKVVAELIEIGYRGDLLQQSYRFFDWFSENEERIVPAATFAQTPLGYDSACFAVVLSNGDSGTNLISKYRALGAPRAFEVRPDQVIHWRVGAKRDQRSSKTFLRRQTCKPSSVRIASFGNRAGFSVPRTSRPLNPSSAISLTHD